jgi:hypothetical protein
MIGIAVAPEVGVALAMHQYLKARAGLERLRVDMPRETESQHVELRKTESQNIESKGTEPKDLESINVDSKGVVSEGTEQKDVESKGVASEGTEPKDVESKDAQVTVLGVGRDEITMAHTFFANMGGFIAQIRVLSLPEQGKTSSNKPDETSSVPKMSHEFILTIEDCRDLSQYICSQLLLHITSTTALVLLLFICNYLSAIMRLFYLFPLSIRI